MRCVHKHANTHSAPACGAERQVRSTRFHVYPDEGLRTLSFVVIGVEKHNSTARSRSSRLNTATILPLSLQENVRSSQPIPDRYNTTARIMSHDGMRRLGNDIGIPRIVAHPTVPNTFWSNTPNTRSPHRYVKYNSSVISCSSQPNKTTFLLLGLSEQPQFQPQPVVDMCVEPFLFHFRMMQNTKKKTWGKRGNKNTNSLNKRSSKI